ncbi:uncharacterized protein EV422DRAFT_498747 [Fimicolochytrium jonesii]|uniref:uncharacterized protein n=1 Tax=Fimicolochytrium jonesii TaxID=1396493 RepID=UPI0022FF0ECD|nr:uncharacterized protein EV422DRAFT_498747 [Fimicolochytrium jonesii]KAI8818584.1 hypothetical protein EV422DRAFT_498747 [Fimicolochytrium jonesii]
MWIPCIDRYQEACTWDISIIIPATLRHTFPHYYEEGVPDEDDEETGEIIGDRSMIVVCSGEPEEEVMHPKQPTKKICRFSLRRPIGASSIMFAVGPFEVIPIPGWFKKSRALHYFEQYLGVPFPYLSYKQIFLEDTYNPVATGATISLFSSHLLLHEHIIDQTYESMRLLCRALVSQWFGHFLVPKSWADTWLLVGLTNYVVALFLQRFFGKNEYKFRLRKDMQRVCELDVNQPPLSPIPIPMDDTQSLKSYVVLHMLDRKLGKGVLRKVITTTLTAASNGELPNGLSTHNFFRLARKLTGKGELKSFADQWVYGSGCPRFSFKYNFNRKKMAVEFRFHQENVNGGIIGSTARFSGPFMIRIHEPGGTYDTEVHLEEQDKQYDIQYHTKYKRIRRKAVTGPRGKKGTGEEQEAVQNEPVEADDMRGENADSKGDWHDEEPDRLDFEWIRLDPDNDWLCVKDFEQTEFMWASQLKKDKDVYAQLDAIAGLSRLPSTGTCTVLSEFINRKMSYYGLRMQAAAVLARCLSDLAVKGSEGALVQQYIDDYCFVPKEGSCEIYARSHDFTELEEYYVQKSIVSALGTIRLDDDYAPKSCQRLLLNLLKFNDNTNNQYSDNYFMANLILALGDAFLPQSSLKPRRPPIVAPRISATSGDALEEIDRRCLLDRFIPSYHNTVTIATLRVKLKWMLAGLIPVDVGLFLQHARQGHFLGVRLMGIDGLFLLKGLAYSQVARFLLAVVADDPVPYVRYHAAKALAEYVEVLVAEGKAVTPENGAGDPLSNGAGANINEFDILRWQIAAQPDTARIVWELMNSAKTLEHRIRVNLLRFCEYLYDPAPEDKTHGVNGGAHTKLKIKMAIKRPHDESGSEDEMALLPPKKVTLKDGNKRRKLDDHKIKLKPQPPPEPLLPPDAGFLAICEKCLDRLISEMAVAEQAQRVASQAVQEEKAAPLSALPSPPPAGELYPAQEPVRELVVPSVPALSIAPAEQLQGTKGGMTAQEFDMCLKLWKVVHGNPVAYWFYAPVDPVALNIPNYPQVIKNPMDLSTIKSKLDQRIYNAPSEFKADVRLMLNNSLQFNPPGTLVHNDSKILLHDFSKAWNERAKYLRDHSTSNAANKVSKIPTGDDKVGTPPPSAGLSSADYAQCSQVLRKLSNAGPIAEPFLEPVSKVLYPYYHEVIKSPMDLHTIRKRLEGKRYKTLRDFEADVRLMLSNCFTFNRPGDPVYTQGKTLETIFEQSWTKPKGTAISKKSSNAGSLPASPAPHTPPAVPSPIGPPPPVTVPEEKAELQPGDRKALQRLLQKLQAHPAAAVFLQPVDPVALNIPHYTQVIKNPMDLGTIQKKLDSGSYVTPAQLAADVELMLSNCFTFNLPEDWVYGQGKILEAEFKKAWKKLLVQQGTSQTAAKAAAKIRKALDAVSAFESAGIFTVPVDPLVLPDYHLKVKNPIDLQTMRGKLDANEYLLLNEFEADMKLLFDNCYTYNEKSSYGHNCGVATEKYFKRLWKSIKGASDSTEVRIRLLHGHYRFWLLNLSVGDAEGQEAYG